MAMSTSEIDQVITLIDRSKNELQSQIDELNDAVHDGSDAVNANAEDCSAVNVSLFRVMFIVTALVQIEIVATAWWLASH